jgi:hypothetical protein
LRSSEGAVSLVVPQFEAALILIVGPVRVANDFQSETAFRAVVSVSERFSDDNLKPGAVAPFNGVCALADDDFENTAVVLIATESRRFRVFCDRRG